MSLVLALNENPSTEIFLPDKVPKSFSTIKLDILFCCHILISITFCQYDATSFKP